MSEHLQNTTDKANKVVRLFIAWNIIFFLLALALKGTMDGDTGDVVLVRGGVWAAGGFLLLYFLNQMSKGQRSAWTRLRIISVLAPIGAIAFVAFTPSLPLWFVLAQSGGAVMLVVIAVLVFNKKTREHFPKAPKA